jgi:hypothetical protein
MPDIELKRLRELRTRAEALLSTLVSDLRPFRHSEETSGFLRKPDSESALDDVNVTTTCSCLMALALADRLTDFYGDDSKKTVEKILSNVVGAPWMSSGLTENNAFTTTLVIRLVGFLVEAGVITQSILSQKNKAWESRLEFSNFESLARKLTKANEPFSRFLFELFPQNVQNTLIKFVTTGSARQKAKTLVTRELTRLVNTTHFDSDIRLKSVSLSKGASTLRNRKLDGYKIAQLNRILLHDFCPREIAPLTIKSLKDIAFDMSSDTSRFKINDYPPAAAVLYWFFDGVARAQMRLPKKNWTHLCHFAAEEFGRQRSLVVANNAAMMDPVAMAMSACLCAGLRRISKELLHGTIEEHHAILPSTIELESSVIDLFAAQKAGIWPKYFPLFHYQDAGSNFCFTFELLEAVLVEFGGSQNRLLTERAVVKGLEQAILWCESNRLQCSEGKAGKPYHGWNSGGNLEPLRRGQPESWATAVVHMFLWELVDVLSRHIQQRLLKNYNARTPSAKWKKLNGLLDIDLFLDGDHVSLKKTLKSTIVKTFRRSFEGEKAQHLRREPVRNEPLSALLFGPPGTSKTEVAKALANELKWQLVEIDPSQFLQDGFQNIYIQAERIFEDVMDLSGVVVLFDEMDALVQKRDADAAPDTESKFLTTYMLPKLAKLHDRGQLIFLMATNYQASFDDAIKRAGRFDFLLCMGPPKLEDKCRAIHSFFELDSQTGQTKTAGKTIRDYAATSQWLYDQLSLYTYGEFLSFISGIGDANEIGTKIEGYGKDGFEALVKRNSQFVSLKYDDLEILKKNEKFKKCKTLKHFDSTNFDEQSVRTAGADPNRSPVIKYVLDRKQSRRQYAKSATQT